MMRKLIGFGIGFILLVSSCRFAAEPVNITATDGQQPRISADEQPPSAPIEQLELLRLLQNFEIPLDSIQKELELFLQQPEEVPRSYISGVKRYDAFIEKGFFGKPSVIPYYLFTLANPSANTTGYALACGDLRLPRLLAVSENGDFSAETPQRSFLLSRLNEYIGAVVEAYNTVPKEVLENASSRAAAPSIIGGIRAYNIYGSFVSRHSQPLTHKTAWGQKAPYNTVITNVHGHNPLFLTSCDATAIAQIMAYHKHPARPAVNEFGRIRYVKEFLQPDNIPSYQEASGFTYGGAYYRFSQINYDWNGMTSLPRAEDLSEPYKMQIGALFFDVASKLNVDYGDTSGGTVLPVSLEELGYTAGKSVRFDFNTVKQSIDASLPVYIKAFTATDQLTYYLFDNLFSTPDPIPVAAGGIGNYHAFVIDNYKTLSGFGELEVFVKDGQGEWVRLETRDIYGGIDYIHCNMGRWGSDAGSDSTWYFIGLLGGQTTQSGYFNLKQMGFGITNYIRDQQIIPFIAPKKP